MRKTIKEPHKQSRPLKRKSKQRKRDPERKEMLKRLTQKKTRRLLPPKKPILPKTPNLINPRREKRSRRRGRNLVKRKAKEGLKSLSTGRKKMRRRLLTISWRRHKLLLQKLQLNLALSSNVRPAIRSMQSSKN